MKNDDVNELDIIHLLHNNYWPEELLSEHFSFVVEHILTPRQRLILEFKVSGCTEQEISKLLKCGLTTIKRQISIIKSKFRHKMELRVDILKPERMRNYYVKAHTKKTKKT